MNITNGTAQTEVSNEEIDAKILSRRSLVLNKKDTGNSMTCVCQFDDSVHLDMIMVSWNGPAEKNVDRLATYHVETWRDELNRTVGSTLSLKTISKFRPFLDDL